MNSNASEVQEPTVPRGSSSTGPRPVACTGPNAVDVDMPSEEYEYDELFEDSASYSSGDNDGDDDGDDVHIYQAIGTAQGVAVPALVPLPAGQAAGAAVPAPALFGPGDTVRMLEKKTGNLAIEWAWKEADVTEDTGFKKANEVQAMESLRWVGAYVYIHACLCHI